MSLRVGRAASRGSVGRVLQGTWPTSQRTANLPTLYSRGYATSPTPPLPLGSLRLPDDYVPPTQPPSARKPDQRKAQLLRVYTALLRSSPLMLFFQHNNLNAVEWAAIRRELRAALAAVPVPEPAAGLDGEGPLDYSRAVELQVLRTRIFNLAFKIVEFFKPEDQAEKSNAYQHDLSKTAYEAAKQAKIDDTSAYGQIAPLLIGHVAAVTFPTVSPAHLAAALKVLSPSPPNFPAPTRRKNPGYWEPTAQSGLQKLILVGGRVEGQVFDNAAVQWVGGIEGGLDGLRAQLVTMLQSAGLGLTTSLEGHSKGLWLTLESRRTQLDEEANGGKKEGDAGAETSA
ncbi:hypothetical protein GGR56DRAFT_616550 [Xylariaceae sp. FL0804]|nr:hypothetical protein GGR56DRAFT_616550 [Xylariaceae sp. FL0804]